MRDPTETAHLPDSPYPGIEPYRYADRKVFFARETESRNLTRLIVMYRGVLLYSDSGSGKSSLINAGLMPLAIEEGYQPQRIRVQPKSGQEIVVERLADEAHGQGQFLPSLLSFDDNQERTVLSVERFLDVLGRNNGTTCPLLIFDQFEEWATLFDGASAELTAAETRVVQGKILDALVSLINDSKLPVKVLISLREDYLAKLTPFFKRCPSLPDQYLRLTPLDPRQIYRVIRGPFEEYPERYPREISPSLAEEIQRQFESRSETDIRLTEVQVVCRSLLESGRQGKELEEFFTRQGGVRGILEQYLKDALKSLPPEQSEPAVSLLTRMVTSAGTRNVISEDDLLGRAEHEDMIPRALLSQTLISLDQDTKLVRRERRREVYYYEIASEFLVDWIRNKAQEHLVQVEQREFKKAQRAADELRRANRQRQLLKGLAAVGVVALLLAATSWRLAKQASREAEESHSARFVQLAQGTVTLKPDLRLLLALHAVLEARNLRQDSRSKAEKALRRVLHETEPLSSLQTMTLRAHTKPVTMVVFSPNGKYLATVSLDNTVRVWDGVSWRELCSFPLEANKQFIGLSFSADSARLATSYRDQSVTVRDASSGRKLAALPRRVGEITSFSLWRQAGPSQTLSGSPYRRLQAAVSLDASRVATVTSEGIVKLWDLRSGEEKAVPVIGIGVSAMALSPDGSRLVAGHRNGEVTVWSETERILVAAFSPDGRRLATGNLIGTVKLWDVSSGKELWNIPGKTGRVLGVTFSPDGARLATAAVDELETATVGGMLERVAVTVWDASSGQELVTLQGKAGSLGRIAFSPDGTRLATVNRNGAVGVWNASSGEELWTTVGQTGGVIASAFSPDGMRLVTVDSGGTVMKFDASSGRELKSLPSHGERVLAAAAFSQDGTRLATASWNNEVRVRETDSGRELDKLLAEGSVYRLAFATDGTRLATAERYQKGFAATVWDLSSGAKLYVLPARRLLAIALSSDGKQMVTLDEDAAMRADVLGVDDLVASASSRVSRPFTLDECKSYHIVHAMQCDAAELVAEGSGLADKNRLKEAIAKFTKAKALDPQLKFDPDAKARQLAVHSLLREGRRLAIAGETSGAAGQFQAAKRLDPKLRLEPETEARALSSNSLLQKGESLAYAGDIGGAVGKFQEALKLNPSLRFDPQIKARKQAAEGLVQKGLAFAVQGNLGPAREAFGEAQKLSPKSISFGDWNDLCWYEGLWGEVTEALGHCEIAVSLSPNNFHARDSRGLARALAGKREAAIEDFQFYIKHSDDLTRKSQRQAWIAALRQGKSPFTPEVLRTLFSQSSIILEVSEE